MAVDNLIIHIILLFLFKISRIAGYEYVLLESTAGPIRGVKDSKGNYTMYLGIPYARINYDNLFGESVPIEKFTETFDAVRDGNRCPQCTQIENSIYYCSLDCLNLSIYVPDNVTSTDQIPVLVFIYGGRYESGTCWRNLFGQQFLVKQNIIVVTMSFRIGIYGFLCLDTPEVPGNQGLKDQSKALRWIKRHIASFGGDPNKITLFGHSSGAHNSDFHLLYSKEPLFNQVILQGGNSFHPSIFKPSNRTIPIILAKYFGFETSDFIEATKFIMEIKPCVLIRATLELNMHFNPCVEKEFGNVERFVTDYPINLADIPNVNNMTLMLGHTEDEMAYFVTFGTEVDHFKNLTVRDYLKFLFNLNDDELSLLEKIVYEFYFGDTIGRKRNFDVVNNLGSDFYFVHPTQRIMRNVLNKGANKVYFSVFTYDGALAKNVFDLLYHQNNAHTLKRPVHAQELPYLMKFGVFKNITAEDQRMIDIMTNLWGNFVKYGDPTPQTSELLPVKWTPITKDSKFVYMNLTLNLSLHDEGLWPERIAFWNMMYDVFKDKQIFLNKV